MADMDLNVGIGDELVVTPADEILAETEVSTGPSAGFIAGAAAAGAAIGVGAVELGKWGWKKFQKWRVVHAAKKEAGKEAAAQYDAEQSASAVIEAAKKGGKTR